MLPWRPAECANLCPLIPFRTLLSVLAPRPWRTCVKCGARLGNHGIDAEPGGESGVIQEERSVSMTIAMRARLKLPIPQH